MQQYLQGHFTNLHMVTSKSCPFIAYNRVRENIVGFRADKGEGVAVMWEKRTTTKEKMVLFASTEGNIIDAESVITATAIPVAA